MSNTFASHPLRILLLILSGEPLTPSTKKHLLHSRKKEHITIVGAKDFQDPSLAQEREVPPEFVTALESIMYKSVAGLDTSNLRTLTSHRVGNPILQLLLRLELSKFGKQRGKDESSIFHTLIPDENLTPDSPSGTFISNIAYDTVGSHLLETVLEFAPAKIFKAIYKNLVKPKLVHLSRNETASYVVCVALERIGKEDLQEAITILGPEFSSLADRGRFKVITTLVERAVAREIDLNPLAAYITGAFISSTPGTFDLTRLLKINTTVPSTKGPLSPDTHPTATRPTTTTTTTTKDHPSTPHASKLIQSLLLSPPPLSPPPLTALTTFPSPLLLNLARHPSFAPLLATALTSPHSPTSARRKLTTSLYGAMSALALDPVGARVVDAVWMGTRGLVFMRERVAEELAEDEPALRACEGGRRVWRTWGMEGYKRKRGEWVAWSRRDGGQAEEDGSTGGFVGWPEDTAAGDGRKDGNRNAGHKGHDHAKKQVTTKGRHLTAIEKARERHGREKARRAEREAKEGRGSQKENQREATVAGSSSAAAATAVSSG
jgi:nucleolar protein 9